MTSLVRTRACGFTLDKCTTFEELQSIADKGGSIEHLLFSIESVFIDLPEIRLSDEQDRMYRNGVKLDAGRIEYNDDSERFRVYGRSVFLGTARIDKEKNELRAEKSFFA